MSQSSIHDAHSVSALVVDAWDQEIARVEEDIRARIAHLWDLRRQRNTLLPVARVPPEMLAEIFLYLRDACIQIPEREASFLAEQSWISVLLVSHSWREIALATPRLWTCVDLLTNKAASDSISRAGSLPLQVFMRARSKLPMVEVLDAVCTHRGRICALSISAPAGSLGVCLPSLVSFAADTLSILEITASLGSFFTPSEAICNLSLPRLEQLTLERCFFEFGCTLLAGCAQSLRKLILRQCSTRIWMDDHSRPILRPTFDVLESLKTLEYLCIVDSLRGWQYTAGLPELRLPSLKHFYIDACQDVGLVFLHTLRIPDTCYAELHMNDFHLSAEQSSNIAAFFLPDPHQLHLTICSDSIRVRAPKRILLLTGFVPWYNTHRIYHMIGTQISAHAPQIYLQLGHAITSDGLRDLCGGAAAVATDVTFQGAPAALDAIAECLADPTGFLPSLVRLRFEGFDIESAYEAPDVQKLVGVLYQRNNLVVEYEGCDTMQEIVDRLQSQ